MQIKGTFLDEISHDIPHQNWGEKEWDADFGHMHRAGIEHVILIRCGYRRWQTFSSQVLTSEERCYEPPADLVGMFLRLSEKWGMKFWFGLYDSGKYWASGDYLHEVELNCRLIDEVWARYGHHAAFGGWYISQECSRNTGKIIDLYARLGRHCKAVSGGLPTLISPYIDGSKNISQYTDRTTRTGGVTAESHEVSGTPFSGGFRARWTSWPFRTGTSNTTSFRNSSASTSGWPTATAWSAGPTPRPSTATCRSSSCRSSGRSCV